MMNSDAGKVHHAVPEIMDTGLNEIARSLIAKRKAGFGHIIDLESFLLSYIRAGHEIEYEVGL